MRKELNKLFYILIMVDILSPLLNKKSTKKLILDELIENQPQTTKEIYLKIKKQKNITYQAIHKLIKEMQKDEILENSKQIKINQKFFNNLEIFLDSLKNKTNQKIKNTENIKSYKVNSFSEAGQIVIKLSHDLKNPDKKICTCLFKHSWPLFGITKKDYQILENLMKENIFLELVNGTTKLDYAFSKPLQDLGKEILHGAKLKNSFDVVIKGNYTIQILFPKKVTKKIDNLFSKCKSIDDLNIVNLLKDFVVEENEIIINTIYDENLAENLRTEILNEFYSIKNKIKTT